MIVINRIFDMGTDYNKLLDIYIKDIEECNDLTVLYEWENKLIKKTQEMKPRISGKRKELQIAFSQQKRQELLIMEDLYANLKLFSRHVHNRIKRVKSQKRFNRNIHLNMLKIFKSIVKERLPEAEYEEIRSEAYRRAEEVSQKEESENI